ncbi:hypothetical protein GCM10023085_40410 [Actinomadura viridis]
MSPLPHQSRPTRTERFERFWTSLHPPVHTPQLAPRTVTVSAGVAGASARAGAGAACAGPSAWAGAHAIPSAIERHAPVVTAPAILPILMYDSPFVGPEPPVEVWRLRAPLSANTLAGTVPARQRLVTGTGRAGHPRPVTCTLVRFPGHMG